MPTKSDKLFRTFIELLAFLTLPALAESQQSTAGIVHVARMPIYKEPSRSGGVETVLNRGDRVFIVGEVTVHDERWCNVVVRDQNQPPGYALCGELRSTPIKDMPNIDAESTQERATPRAPIRVMAQQNSHPRVFITDSQSWAAIGSFGTANGSGGGGIAGGSSPQTVEVIDDFAKQCPNVIVSNDKWNADYIVLFDRDAAAKSRTVLSRADKIAVFKKNGDLVYSGKSRSVANTVKDACAALVK